MQLTHQALKRPIAVAMIFLALGLLGFLSWQRLPLELMPSLNYPQLTVVANCENLVPLEMEALVTKPLESALGTVSRVRQINSVSREGVSLITLDFDWGANMNYASLDVREKLDQVRDLLPKEAATPMIVRYDPGSLPVATLAVQGGPALSFDDLQELASNVLKRELERVPGVASVRLSGAKEREIRVAVDPASLVGQRFSLGALNDALKDSNINYPGGKIVQHHQEIRLRVLGEFKKLEDLGKVGVSRARGQYGRPGGTPSFIRDMAEVQDTYKEDQSVARLNGKPSLILGIFKMADANTVQVVDRVKERVAGLNQEYKGKLSLLVVQDQGRFVQQAIYQLEEAAVLGGLLSFGVLLGFLASLPSALIIMTAIPISIFATFSLMYLAGISLNMMSLGGLALGVGMLVDNGVVVLENIKRHQELGETSSDAAIVRGTDEVKLAVTASTLAHIVVFIPVIFVKGLAGQFLYQVGLTISFSLLISLGVALILNPMLVSLGRRERRALAAGEPERPRGAWAAALKARMDATYGRGLKGALAHRGLVLLGAGALMIAGLLIILSLGRELLPALDQREFLLKVTAPPNSTLEAASERLRSIEDLLLAHTGVETVITQLGYNPKEQYEKVLEEKETRVGTVMVTLKPQREWRGSAAAAVRDLRPQLERVPEARIEYIFPQSLGQWLGQKPQVPELLTIRGPELEVLEKLSQELLGRIEKVKGVQDLETSLRKESQESRVVLDRERAAAFGLSIKEIGETLKYAIQGEVPTQFRQADKDIDIRVQLRGARKQSLPDLEKLFIYSKVLKADIPLQEVARIDTGPGLTEVNRRDQERIVAVRGNVAGRSLGEVQGDIARGLSAMNLPPGYTLTQGGEAAEMGRSFSALFWALLLSVLLVYMILAGQFESLLHPFIILLAVPFSLTGVALALGLTGWGVSLGVYFGAIMLGGIVVNNSILLIDYTNTMRRRGYSLEEAVVMGSRARLRPIIMTTLTTCLGLAPLVVARGEGAELRAPLALTVLGGLIASTFLTLILMPLLYYWIEERLGRWRSRGSSYYSQ
jgi:HAE1 family hydrophobic/amphiphilic exporter-1